MKHSRLLSILIGLITLSLVSPVMAQLADAGSLAGTQWQLVSYGTPDSLTTPVEGSAITLEFPADNQIAGSGGCNSYSGAYGVQEANIEFRDIVSTLMACTDSNITQQEQTYLDALGSASGYAQTDLHLTLWYDNGQQQLNFARVGQTQDMLQNTKWQLVSYGASDSLNNVIETNSVTLEFLADNQITGSGGCNSYSGAYSIDQDNIEFQDVVSTLMACADAAINQQEQTYFDVLGSVNAYALTDTSLTLSYADGQQLNFVPVIVENDVLENSEWQLESYGTADALSTVIADSNVSIHFLADKQVEGNGGCNTYSAKYETTGTSISFSDIVHTELACADQSMATQEQAFFDALQSADEYQGYFDRLVISYDGGQLNFVIVPNEANPKVCSNPWVVEAGDTLSNIAQVCNTTLDALLATNPDIDDPSLLFVGQEIIIPTGDVPLPTQAPNQVPTQVPTQAAPQVSNPQAIVFPELSGQYPVGRASYYLVDTGRHEIFTDDQADERELGLTVYYPAELPANAQPAPYAEGVLRDSLLIPAELVDLVQTHVYANVPLVNGNFPVLIFSPGMGALPVNYTSLLSDVASHGYVVAAISHPYSTALTVFPDGHAVYANAEGSLDPFADPAISQADYERIGSVWVSDIMLTLNQLGEFNGTDGLLAGHLNMDQVGIFGHSFGGGAALEASYQNDSFKAVLNMDGPVFGTVKGQALLKPFMAMFSNEWTITDEAVAQAGVSRADYETAINTYISNYTHDLQSLLNSVTVGYSVHLTGIAHFSFATDLMLFAPQVPETLPQTTVGTMPAERAIQIMSAYTVAFFNKYLKGQDSGLLNADSAVYPDVSFEVFPNS